MKWVNRLYIIFLGIILTITTGYGIAAFYPEQRAPIYPSSKPYISSPSSCYSTPQDQQSEECKKYLDEEKVRQAEDSKRQEEYQKKMEDYQNTNSAYTRTAVFLGISVGTLFVVLGLAMLKSSHLVSNGLLFAGVLTAVLTRVLVGIASLGSRVVGTGAADQMSYIQFAILVVLSIAVTFVGFSTLKEEK